MSETEMVLSLTVLTVSLAGLAVSTVLGLRQAADVLMDRRADRAELADCQAEAIALDQLRTDLLVLEMEYQWPAKPVNYRHNLHCPVCGRFAARVLPDTDTVVMCSAHDMQVRWRDIPVDWATEHAVSYGMVVHAELVSAESQAVLQLGDTGPIEIIYDQVSLDQLEAAGAVL